MNMEFMGQLIIAITIGEIIAAVALSVIVQIKPIRKRILRWALRVSRDMINDLQVEYDLMD